MDSVNENVIEWLRGHKKVAVTLASNTKMCNKVKSLAQEYPDEVKILANNNDGSIFAHIPLSYVRIIRPREMTEEQKERLRSMAKKNAFLNNHLATNDQIEALDDEIEIEDDEELLDE